VRNPPGIVHHNPLREQGTDSIDTLVPCSVSSLLRMNPEGVALGQPRATPWDVDAM